MRATAGIGMIFQPFMPYNGEQQPSGPPDYKVYRSRKGLLSRLRTPDLSSLQGAAPRAPKGGAASGRGEDRAAGARRAGAPLAGKRVLKWVGLAALGWILLSFLAFAVSAQLQSFKLSGDAKDALHGNPCSCPARRRSS